jgi:hypothetical protein
MTSRPRTLKQKFDEKVERGLDRLEASTVAPVGKYFNHQKDRFKEAASLEAKKIGLDAPGLSVSQRAPFVGDPLTLGHFNPRTDAVFRFPVRTRHSTRPVWFTTATEHQ